MKMFMLLIVLFCVLQTEPQSLFSKVDVSKNKLTTKQEKILDRIHSNKRSLSWAIVKLNKFDYSQPLSILLTKNDSKTLNKYECSKEKDTITVRYEDTILVITGDCISGLIYHNDKVYEVVALGEGLQVLMEIDQSSFGPDEEL